MPRRAIAPAVLLAALSAAFPAAALVAASPAAAPVAPPQLAGTWTLVAVDNVLADGTRTQPYGPHPEGILMFDAAGRYALQILRAGRARYAANDKSRGTAEEYADTVMGTNSHFGRYLVDAGAGTLTFRIEHASYPNWEGTEQRRSFTLVDDLLTYTVPVTTTGGAAIGEVSWRRAR
ncbi:MAG TPA: lipocalin-like domain-containing protein [Thermoanaerobaculia bacterium]|jgi:hypothetical protein|nr:lipocalin-like domain-containing protein [Thermoanaerobaculia bacterium]